MPFIEVEKTKSGGGKSGAAAAFTTSKKGTGSLRINGGAMEFLKGRGKSWEVGDKVKIFHDPETAKLAIKKTADGRFRLAKNAAGANSLRISSKDLTDLIKKPTEYAAEASPEYDIILSPKS